MTGLFCFYHVGVDGDEDADEVAPGTETAPGVETAVTSQVLHQPFKP